MVSLSNSLESVQAEKALLERENMELKAAAKSTGQPRRGATVKYIGQHHFTDPAAAAKVVEVELAGKGKRAAAARKRVPTASQRPTEEGPELREWILAHSHA